MSTGGGSPIPSPTAAADYVILQIRHLKDDAVTPKRFTNAHWVVTTPVSHNSG